MVDSKPTTPAWPAGIDHNNPVSNPLLAQLNETMNTGDTTLLHVSSPLDQTLQAPGPDSRSTTPGLLTGIYTRPMSPDRWELIQAPSSVLGSRTTESSLLAGNTYNNPVSEHESLQINGNPSIGNAAIRQQLIFMPQNGQFQRKLPQY
jgi:hypothetical protein